MPSVYQQVILSCSLALLLISCSNDYDKHIDAFNDCVEKKQDDKKYKYSNIQEAINAYDFAVARDYLACHPSRKKMDKSTFGSRDFQYPYQEDLKLIVESEITYYISQGEFEKAEATAKEAGTIEMGFSDKYNMVEHYEKQAAEGTKKKIDELLDTKQFEGIHNLLADQRAIVQANKYDLNQSMWNDDNERYNDRVREYNASLDKVLAKYKYLKVDKQEISAIIDLALPELAAKGKGSGLKLSDVYRAEATQKYLK